MAKDARNIFCRWLSPILEVDGVRYFYCERHHLYHNATQVRDNCYGLKHVHKLPDYIKREMTMKKPEQQQREKSVGISTEDKFAKKFPTIVEYLTTDQWEDGSDRELSSLSMFVEDGKWKAAINDKAMKRSCYVTAESFDDALGRIEKALATSSADWRAWTTHKRNKTK